MNDPHIVREQRHAKSSYEPAWADIGMRQAKMVPGMLAEPWHLKGHQEARLQELSELMQMGQGRLIAA
jgi:hypothetical protein